MLCPSATATIGPFSHEPGPRGVRDPREPVKILRAYKTELDPTVSQTDQLLQHAGCARWAYNWGLRRKIESYEKTRKSPSWVDLNRELNALKKLPVEAGGIPWMYESSKCAPQEALRNLDRAFEGFFRRCKQGAARKGFPRFKSRKRGVGGFRFSEGIKVSERLVQLPRLGEIKLKQRGYLPTSGVKILSAAVSERAGRWFVSIQVEQEVPDPSPKPTLVLGVDVGIKSLAVTSEGEVFSNPKALQTAQKLLRARQKSLARKQKGSNNRRKAAARVARLHARISDIRKDSIHKMTTAITKQASMVVIEDLNVAGMLRNHCLARSLSDASLGEIHRQLTYKTKWRGVELRVADRFFPSSKRCSGCGAVKTSLSLSERVYRCERCGLEIDRDLNAAINLKDLAGSSPVSACRPGGSGDSRKRIAKPLVGQEPNREASS
jgi:putative transposase